MEATTALASRNAVQMMEVGDGEEKLLVGNEKVMTVLQEHYME